MTVNASRPLPIRAAPERGHASRLRCLGILGDLKKPMVGPSRSVEVAFWVSAVEIHQNKFSRWHAPVIGAVVAIYTRVSHEDAEQPSSTRRQELACREYAQARGWDIVDVYEDIDLSAYDRRVRRPAFDRLMRTVAGGQVNGVLVWKLDRLVRRSVDFERFWERCERAGIFLTSVTERLDSTNEIGLAVVRMLVNFAKLERARSPRHPGHHRASLTQRVR
jgi:predicted site-specific integrase-resolvase